MKTGKKVPKNALEKCENERNKEKNKEKEWKKERI